MSDKEFRVGVLQVFVSKLMYEMDAPVEVKSSIRDNISFQKLKNPAPEGNLIIQARMPITHSNERYTLKATVNGVFIVPTAVGELIGKEHSSDPDSEELKTIRLLADEVVPILFDKFRLVSAQFSLENSNYPIFPTISYNVDTLLPKGTHKDSEK